MTDDLIAGALNAHDPDATVAKVKAMTEARLDAAREVVDAQAWDRVELPPIARRAFPDLDLTRPETLPEPHACAEGRPWGPDPYGPVWGTPDQRWASYIEGGGAMGRRQRCRNRWRDRDTLLCGTHLNVWRRQLDDAAKRVRKAEAHARHTRLARELGGHGIPAEAASGGVLLRPADARLLLRVLDEAVRRAGGTVTAAAHLVELLDTDRTAHATPDRKA